MDGGAGVCAGGEDKKKNKNNKAKKNECLPGEWRKKKALIALQGIFGNFLDEKHHLAADKFV